MVKLVKLVNYENRDKLVDPSSSSSCISDDEEYEYENEGTILSNDDDIESELFNDQFNANGM